MKNNIIIVLLFALCFGFKAQAQDSHVKSISVDNILKGLSSEEQSQLKDRLYGRTSFIYVTSKGEVDFVETEGKPFEVIEIEDLNATSFLKGTILKSDKCKVLILNVGDTIPTTLNIDLSSFLSLEYILIRGQEEKQLAAVESVLSKAILEGTATARLLIEKISKDR